MNKVLKPFTNIFDVVDVTYNVFNVIGAASFSRIRRSDGRNVYFIGEWDYLMSVVICLFSLVGFIMLFYYSPYVVETSMQDCILYRFGFFIVCMEAITTRLLAGRRVDLFLKALHLVDQVDKYLKNRRLPLYYDSGRYLIGVYLLIPAYCVPLFTIYYYDDTTRKEDSFYEIIHILFCFTLPYAALSAHTLYIMAIAMSVKDRISQLGHYLDKLKILKNPKIIEQELIVVSKLHFKLCKSWKFAVKSCGLSNVCFLTLAYIYCFLPLAVMGYVLPKLHKISLPVAIVLTIVVVCFIRKYEGLRSTVEDFKLHLIGLTLERNNEENIRTVAKTLLLQIEHWNIDLIFSGFVTIDSESYLEGLKTVSTFMMFFIQMQNM